MPRRQRKNNRRERKKYGRQRKKNVTKQQQMKEKIAIADKLKQNPNDASIYNELCQRSMRSNDYYKALRFGFLAIKCDPSIAGYWINYASCCKKLGNDNKSAIAYQTAKDLGANQTEIPEMKQQQEDYMDGFDNLYAKDLQWMQQEALDKAVKNHADLSRMMDKRIKEHGRNGSVSMSTELIMLAIEKPEVIEVMSNNELFVLRMESKYQDDDYINSLPQIKRVWNLRVDLCSADEEAGMHNVERQTGEPEDPREIDHRFENDLVADKEKYNIQMCNVSRSDGAVMWVNHGHLSINSESEWTELNDHYVYGMATGQQILDVIKRVICGHRVAINGVMKAERPRYIIIQEGLDIDYAMIKKALNKFNIDCLSSSEVPKTIIMGMYDGYVMHG